MARYGRDLRRYDRDHGPGWTGGGAYPAQDYRREGYSNRPRRYERGLEIGPVWGGGSDVGYRAHPSGMAGYDRGLRARPEPGGYDRRPNARRRSRPAGYDWWYW